jgi:branched-chain amino acid transport system permease protein
MTAIQFYGNVMVNGIVEGLIIALAALALTLVFAVARFPNAATGDYMTFGAYVAKGIGLGGTAGFLPAVIGGCVATAGLSIFFHLWVFRRLARQSHAVALVASIGVAFLVRNVLAAVVGEAPITYGLPLTRARHVYGLILRPTDFWLAVAAIVTLAAVFALLHLTPVGRRLRAIADSMDLARASGIRPGPALLILWSSVGMVCAIAGILLAVKSVLQPDMGWQILLPSFTAAIVGGIGNPLGAVLGGLIIGIVQEWAGLFVGHSYDVAVSFVVLAILLLVRPQGLLGRFEGAR